MEEWVPCAEVFIEAYNLFEAAASGELSEEALLSELKEALYYYVSDYCDVTVPRRIREQVDPSLDFAVRIIMESDLSDLRYLYRFGEYETTEIEIVSVDAAGEELLSRPIALGCALEVRDHVACEFPELCCMAYGYHTWVTTDRRDPRVAREERIVGVESVEGTLEEHFSERGLHKFLLVGESDAIERAEREVGRAFPWLSVVRSSPILCEVMDGHVSKTEGIGVVCERLGTSLGDAVAFGDGRNDIDMLRAVPRSWAMANAPAEVRAAAAYVTALDNDHDGLAETLFALLGVA